MSLVFYETVMHIPDFGVTMADITRHVGAAERHLRAILPEAWGLQRFRVSHLVRPVDDDLRISFVLDPSEQLVIDLYPSKRRKLRGLGEGQRELEMLRAVVSERQANVDQMAPALRREIGSVVPLPQDVAGVLQALLQRPGSVYEIFPAESPQRLCIPGFDKHVVEPRVSHLRLTITQVSSDIALAACPRRVVSGQTRNLPHKKLRLYPTGARFGVDIVQAMSIAMAEQGDIEIDCQLIRQAITDAIVGGRVIGVRRDS